MTMSTLFSIISIIFGLGLAMTAIALLAQALFPQWVARSAQRVSQKPVRTFFAGLVLAVVLLGIGLTLCNTPAGPSQFLGLVVLSATFGLALAGAAGVVQTIGAGLPSPADELRPWKAIIRGWVVLFFASLTPLLGWFFFLPVALLLGLGGAVLGLRRGAPASAAVSEPEPIVEAEIAEMPGSTP